MIAFNLFGKIFIILGFFLILVGLVLNYSGYSPISDNLPDDNFFKKENFSFYFSIATSMLFSIVLIITFSLFIRR